MADLQTKKPKKPENHIHMEMFQCVPTWTAVKSPWLHLIQVMAMHTKCIVKLVVPFWLNFITCVYAKLIKAFELFHNVCKLGYQFLAVVRFSVRYYDVNDRLRWPSFQHRPNMKWNITIGTLVNFEPKDFQSRTATSVVPSCILSNMTPRSSVKPKGNRTDTTQYVLPLCMEREQTLNSRFLACKILTSPSYLAKKRIFRTYCQR